MHGYQVMREINERSGGVWRPSPGSIYPTLQQLQDEGLVESEEQRRGRKLFVITDEGRAEVATREGQPAPWEQVGDEFTSAQVGLRDLVFQIGAAAKQVMIAGTPEQASRAEALLKETAVGCTASSRRMSRRTEPVRRRLTGLRRRRDLWRSEARAPRDEEGRVALGLNGRCASRARQQLKEPVGERGPARRPDQGAVAAREYHPGAHADDPDRGLRREPNAQPPRREGRAPSAGTRDRAIGEPTSWRAERDPAPRREPGERDQHEHKDHRGGKQAVAQRAFAKEAGPPQRDERDASTAEHAPSSRR